MKNTKSLRLALLAIACALSLAVAFAFAGNKTAEAATSYGNMYFHATNATVESFSDKAGNINTDYNFFRTEVSPTAETSEMSVTLNQTVIPRQYLSHFLFDTIQQEDANIAIADMVAITFTSAFDTSKQLSVISRVHSGVWARTVLSLTDDIEVRGQVTYIKGTNQEVVGGSSYNYAGTDASNNKQKTGGAVFGGNLQIQILEDGTVQHNQWQVYGNILNETFLTNSRTKLDPSNPNYERYTTEWANQVMTALSKECVMTIKWYNLNTSETVAFAINYLPQGNNANQIGTGKPNLRNPYSLLKDKKFYAGESYKYTDILDTYNEYTDEEGNPVIALYETGKPNVLMNDTVVTMDAPGTKTLNISTYCNYYGQSWSNVYLAQTFNVVFLDASPVVTAKANPAKMTKDETYGLADYFDVEYPLDYELTYTYTVDGEATSTNFTGDGEDHVFGLTVTDTKSRTSGEVTVSVEHAHRWNEGVITTAAGCETVGVKTYTCLDCGDTDTEDVLALGHDYVAHEAIAAGYKTDGNVAYYTCSRCDKYFDAEKNVIAAGDEILAWRENYAPVRQMSISTAGDIGLNFYFSRPANAETATAVFSLVGVADSEQAAVGADQGDGTYKYTYPVAPKDYKQVVKLTVTLDGDYVIEGQFSVETYAQAVEESNPAKNVVDKLISYCEQARAYFAKESVEEDETAVDLTSAKATKSGEDAKVSDVAATLILESKTTIKVYFKATESVACKVDGENAEVTDEGDGIYSITIKNIVAKDLNETYAITVGDITVNYSALAYAESVLRKSDDIALKNLVKAMYALSVAADAYFA